MNSNQILFLLINILGGVAVILSYIIGFKSAKGPETLWGGVPKKLRNLYTFSILTSAVAYFVFSSYIFKMLAGNVDLSFFYYIYATLLTASALWLPLVNMMAKKNRKWTWISIRTVLVLTSFSFFLLLVILLCTVPTGIHYYISVIGLVFATLHTGVLDAILWPHYWKTRK